MHFPTSESFLLFVSRVLYFRNSLHIKKFDLTCNSPELFSHIDGWIRTAVMQNLVELDLCVENEDLGRDMIPKNELFELPKSLFMCKTLVVLKLWSPFIINTPSSWCLPCLKVMFITINYPDGDPMEWLLPGCPALEDLSISGHGGDGSLNLNISAVELMKLRIKFGTLEDNHLDLNVFVKLEYFGLEQTALSNIYFLEDSKFLVKASIDLNYCMATDHPGFAGRATALLAQICNVKSLSL